MITKEKVSFLKSATIYGIVLIFLLCLTRTNKYIIMKRLRLIMPAILIVMTFNTSCKKEEEAPTPVPVVTPTTPVPTTQVLNYFRGSGFTDLNLEVRDASNNQIFYNNVYSSTSISFSINEDESYTYSIVANGNTFYEDGTFGYNSTSGMWNTANNPPTQVAFFNSSGNDVYIWKP